MLLSLRADKILVCKGIWRHLTLYLGEGTLEDIDKRPRLDWWRRGLVAYLQVASWAMEPILAFMPT